MHDVIRDVSFVLRSLICDDLIGVVPADMVVVVPKVVVAPL